MPDQNWQFELEEYIKQGEPDRAEKSEAWQTAIGLQAVDGLNTSAYLLDTAKDHIEGKITIDEAQQRIHSYYEQRTTRTEIENETKEADIVSARIAKLLGEKAFQFSPAEWLSIHRRLFEGVFSHAGQIRQYNITKKEWVLNGDTVIYADWNSIKDTLDYDFATEKQFSYEGLSVDAAVKHLAKFASGIWQIHPFGEGNTRATAVFMIKYMKTFGFRVNNDAFEKNSWYFRNALVRANYTNLQKGVHATTKFLEMFFSNLLLGTNHDLKNRYNEGQTGAATLLNLTTSDESIAHYDDVKQNNLTVSFIPYKTGVTGGDFLIEDYFSWDKTVKPMVDKAIENSHHPFKNLPKLSSRIKKGLEDKHMSFAKEEFEGFITLLDKIVKLSTEEGT